jgi:LacI family transcriptional regulator
VTTKCLRVALLIESSRMSGRQFLRGIAAYARNHGSWTFFHEERALGDPIPPELKQWKPHGIIVRLTGAKLTRQIRQMKVPAVDLYREDETPGIPGVAVDQNALIRMALDHFLERGFNNFAYCGFTNVLFSELRAGCFAKHLAERGLHGNVFTYPGIKLEAGLAAIEAHALRYADKLLAWLGRQPKPLALLACNDERAQQVLTLCRQGGIAVPNQVAVLGVDNDEVECELCDPPLSSIDPDFERIGYQAAALLDRMMKGKVLPPSRILVPALRVVARRSTDVLAVDDADAAEAIRFVREHACEGILIEDIMKHMSISRSSVQRWFKKYLGHSPAVEIIRIRVQRIQESLRTTNMTSEEIADATGFLHVESMRRMFKRMVGLTPGRYRKQASGSS